jgi:hypothetical protein
MKTHYLIASLAMFLGIALILWGVAGCTPYPKQEIANGTYDLSLRVTVQDDYCLGREGWIGSAMNVKPYRICISKHGERSMWALAETGDHELWHVLLYDAKQYPRWPGHPGYDIDAHTEHNARSDDRAF